MGSTHRNVNEAIGRRKNSTAQTREKPASIPENPRTFLREQPSSIMPEEAKLLKVRKISKENGGPK